MPKRIASKSESLSKRIKTGEFDQETGLCPLICIQETDVTVRLIGNKDDDECWDSVLVIRPQSVLTIRVNDNVGIYLHKSTRLSYAKIQSIYVEKGRVKAGIQWYYSQDDLLATDEETGDFVLVGGMDEMESQQFNETDYAFAPHHYDVMDVDVIDSLADPGLSLHSTPFVFDTRVGTLVNTHLSFSSRENDSFAGFLTSTRYLMFSDFVPFGADFFNRFIKPYIEFGIKGYNYELVKRFFFHNRLLDLSVESTALNNNVKLNPDIESQFIVESIKPEIGICQLCKTHKTLTYDICNWDNEDGLFLVGVHCYQRIAYVHRVLVYIEKLRSRIEQADRNPDDYRIKNLEAFIATGKQRLMAMASEAERDLR